MKTSFGEYVKEFNAKCFTLKKIGYPETGKALGWVADKKDARDVISNEIDGDDNAKFHRAFIKTLASGGDTMDGKRLWENEISFVPQFTMFLCYTK